VPIQYVRVPPQERRGAAKAFYTDLIGPEYSRIYKQFMSGLMAKCWKEAKTPEELKRCLASPELKKEKIGPALSGVWG